MLYKPEKYKILEGSKTNIALCTCWLDPFVLKNDIENLKSRFSITGTLYSKEGVSILLRNLALNPHIRYLLVWSNTPLSNTPFGKAGRELLFNVFNNTFDESEIHSEINRDILGKIVSNVEIIDLVDAKFEDLLTSNFGYYKNNNEYMHPTQFNEPSRDDSKPLPSEKVGWVTRNSTIYDTWLNVIDRVMRYGHVKQTEYGNNMRELHQINWVIENENIDDIYIPVLNEKILEIIGLGKESLNKYKNALLDPSIPSGTAYTYGSRLRNYDSLDQVNFFIEKLKACSNSRRVVASTLIPLKDTKASSPPCLTQLQALTDENNKLTLFANFRSHDLFKAAIPNAFALLNLQKHICENTSLKAGPLSISSISAHIYEEDWDNAKQLLKCQKWSDINFRFNEKTETDPRGIIKIYLAKDKINLELTNDKGEVLYGDSGKNGVDLAMKLSKLNLLSRSDHTAYVTYELVKADICLKSNVDFTQDRPLKINNINLVSG